MQLADLETGMVLEFRNGNRGIVIKSIYGDCVYYAHLGCNEQDVLSVVYTTDLRYSHECREGRDIMKVLHHSGLHSHLMRANKLVDTCNTANVVLWEREEVVEMTIEEVCEALGKTIKIVKEK
jgi:hypothetical protein